MQHPDTRLSAVTHLFSPIPQATGRPLAWLLLLCLFLPLPGHAAGQVSAPDAVVRLTWFDDNLVGENPAPGPDRPTMEEIRADLEQTEKDYLELLDEGDGVTGLFATGEYSDDTANGEDRYYGQLELRLFNDGLMEEVRRKEKKILQTRLELLQLHRDMADRVLGHRLYRVHTIANSLRYEHNRNRVNILEPELDRRLRAGEQGYATRTDILGLRHALASARREMEFYRQRNRGRLEPEQAALLDRIEDLRLKSGETLMRMARDNDPTLKIQDVFTRRAGLYPAWSDNLAVDLFAGHKKEYYDRERDYIGIKVEIPLSWDNRADELVALQQRIYRTQRRAVEQRLAEKLDRLTGLLGFHQEKIRTLTGELALLLAREQAALQEIADPVQRQGDDPWRTLHTVRLRMVDVRFAAMEHRLEAYGLGLRLMALTGADGFRALFESPR